MRVFRSASKKNELDAGLIRFYGIDVVGLSVFRRHGLLANMGRLKAQAIIERGDYDWREYEGVYDLFMAAYGDETRARKAKLGAMTKVMREQTEAARLART